MKAKAKLPSQFGSSMTVLAQTHMSITPLYQVKEWEIVFDLIIDVVNGEQMILVHLILLCQKKVQNQKIVQNITHLAKGACTHLFK